MKLVIENVEKKFGEKQVLRGINFTFEKGKIYGLLGRNGAGKTTLFNCLNNDIDIDNGKFYIISDDSKKRDLDIKDIGYVISVPTVPEFLTGREFLKFFLDINKDKIENIKTIDEYFDFMKIEKQDRDKLLKDYSHGMKNKMQMLINIISKHNMLLIDEPFTSLDVEVAEEMKEMLKGIKENHIIIFSTHIMDLAVSLCDDIVILSHGILERVDKNNLNSEEVKKKIIEALKEEEYHD